MDISQIDSSKSLMQNVKQRFFALRNGMVADMLRRAGIPARIIFGLSVPELRRIADAFGVNAALARDLWHDVACRESRLLAPMLMGRAAELEELERWVAEGMATTEEADILAHAWVRGSGMERDVALRYADSEVAMERYLALRVCFSLLAEDSDLVKTIAEKELERNEGRTRGVARQLLDEVEFLSGGS